MQSEIGQTTITFVQQNFRNRKFGGGSQRWAERKSETKKSRGKAILVSSGKMRAGFVVGGKSKDSDTESAYSCRATQSQQGLG